MIRPEPLPKLAWEDLPRLPPRAADSHKGDYGHVYVVGGAPGMGGAAALAALAAYRAGAGLVTVACHPEHIPYLATWVPEATRMDWPGTWAGRLPAGAVLALGPGMGQGLAAHDLLLELGECPLPQVWDADALNILARFGPDLLKAPAPRVFTPHPGEAARLLGQRTADVQRDRAGAAGALAARYGGVWILKGHGSLVAEGEQRAICPFGNPGMASGGMGDALTGIVAGLLAQGMGPWDAACLGVCLHARAGDVAASRHGEAGLLARDLIDALPAVLGA